MSKKKSGKSKKMPVITSDVLALRLVGGFVLVGLGVLIFLSVIVQMQGDIFLGLRSVCYGMAGALAPILCIPPVWGGVLMILSTQQKAPLRPYALACLILLLVLTFANLITQTGDRMAPQFLLDYFYGQDYASRTYGNFLQKGYAFSGSYHVGGGWLGMVLGWPMWTAVGSVPAAIVCVVGIIVAALFLFQLDLKQLASVVRQRADAHRSRTEEQNREQERQDRQWQQQQQAARAQAAHAAASAVQQNSEDWQTYKGPAQPYQPQQPAPEQSYEEQPRSARRSRKPAVQTPADYGFQPTPEELTDLHQELPEEEGRKPRRSRILSGDTQTDMPQKPKRRSIFARNDEDEPEQEQPRQKKPNPYSRTAHQPAVHDEPTPIQQDDNGQPVQPWQSRTAPLKPVSPARTAQPTAQVQSAAQPKTAPRKPPVITPETTAALQQPKSSWTEDDDLPPWEERTAPIAMEDVRVPVVQQQSPEGWLPDPDLAPVKNGQSTYGEQYQEEQLQIEQPYVYPGLDLLAEPVEQTGISPEEDAMRAQRLEETLASFKVQATVKHITHGPAISRFELELAAGINVNRVTNLGANIAMNMEVKSVRIEAPIPGKSLVGIEVPNRKVATVTLREVMESEAMAKAKSPLVVALGKDIAGTPIVCDLARMPHLLIAGATGSGKSVCINTMINSLLYRCSPKEVRMILVDPKVVELQCYNGIPHLLIPVVSDPHKAAGALAWAVGEMMDRYKKFQHKGVRAIDGYNANLKDDEDFMPRIVIIIDELADLMMTCKRDVEDHICRLAQLARAAGIHLVVATQRPSVDVITGLIKANIPSRIAFKVSSFIDSRTILDKNGAEQLLGWGDMLYQPTGEFTPIRIQGCYLSDNEVNNITDFIRDKCPNTSYDPSVIEQLDQLQREASGAPAPDQAETEADLTGDGSLLEQAIEMAVRDGQVSTSLIQRRLKIGYARAGRLVDEMEKRGIVSQKDGAKPRMCLISLEDYEQMRSTNQLAD